MRFPEGFLWGAATAAYQIEGSPLADGAGPSTWHRFAHVPGKIVNCDTGDVACDHYRRWRSDIALMRELGLQSYRFSVSWSRVLPEGRGRANQAGLDFYERLVDGLLEAGIAPNLTLYHWDLPAALDDRGGWLNSDIAHWFADYAALLFERLDGRVKLWSTLNEPWVIAHVGYLAGDHAPGRRSKREAAVASHHLMRSHGAAVKAYRELGRHEIGLVINIEPKYPHTDKPADIEAAARAEAYMNRQYLDAALLGGYPEEMPDIFGAHWTDWPDEDFALIRQKLDFVGINYYTRSVVEAAGDNVFLRAKPVRQDAPHTEMGWEVFPKGLTDTLLRVKERYGDIPLYITENGAAIADPPVAEGGRVADPQRIDYYRTHLAAVHAAIEQGVDVRGYYAWSLLDNFEWSFGYAKRFGIVHVDFATQTRAIKDSGRFYAEVIATNGGALEG